MLNSIVKLKMIDYFCRPKNEINKRKIYGNEKNISTF